MTQVLSIMRHIASACGGAVFFSQHESVMTNVAGLIVWAIPAMWGAWKARRDMIHKDNLANQAADAKEKTALVTQQSKMFKK